MEVFEDGKSKSKGKQTQKLVMVGVQVTLVEKLFLRQIGNDYETLVWKDKIAWDGKQGGVRGASI